MRVSNIKKLTALFRLFQDGQLLMAILNITLSVVVGFVGVWVGAVAGRIIP